MSVMRERVGKWLKLQVLDEKLAVCRLAPQDPIPAWAVSSPFFSLTRTGEELSVVCLEDQVPDGIVAKKNWGCLKVLGPLDFSLVGILAKISGVLAAAGISIFAISSYDTDYILLPAENLDRAVKALRDAGYEF
jgi:hypothetical protein